MENYLIIECPHCNELILINKNEINCSIFRHGVFKVNMEQINPHLDKKSCDDLKSKDLIYGCSKPFRLINEKPIICDYI
jgi:DNA-directed RNA polymerase subunit RPC12/RpoP